MPVGKHCKRNCYKKSPVLSQISSHVLQGGGGNGMYCGGPKVLPPKFMGGGNGMFCGGPNVVSPSYKGGGMHLGGKNVPNPMAKPATKSRDEFFKNFGMNR